MGIRFIWIDADGRSPALKDQAFEVRPDEFKAFRPFIMQTPAAGVLRTPQGQSIQFITSHDSSGVAQFAMAGKVLAVALLLAGAKTTFDMRTMLIARALFPLAQFPEGAVAPVLDKQPRPLAMILLPDISLYGNRDFTSSVFTFCQAFFATERGLTKVGKSMGVSFGMSAMNLMQQMELDREETEFVTRTSEDLGPQTIERYREQIKTKKLRPRVMSTAAAVMLLGAQESEKAHEQHGE